MRSCFRLLENCPASLFPPASAFAASYSAFQAASDVSLAAFTFAFAASYTASACATASVAATASEIVVVLSVPSDGFASSAFSFAASYSALARACSASASESVDGCDSSLFSDTRIS